MVSSWIKEELLHAETHTAVINHTDVDQPHLMRYGSLGFR